MFLKIELEQEPKSFAPPVLARLRLAKPSEKGGWLAYCELLQPSSEGAQSENPKTAAEAGSVPEAARQPRQPISPRDRRRVRRYLCRSRPELSVRVQASSGRMFAVLRDISPRGIGLLVDGFVKPEMILEIDLPNVSGQQPLILTARVRHAVSLPDQSTLLGCSLERELCLEDVLALL
jgi:hypothetical protein